MSGIRKKPFNCPVEVTLAVIGGRWKSLILWYLRTEPLRFSQLQRLIPNITQRMLTHQLRELEHDGIVARKVFVHRPLHVEYSLTSTGRTLRPILDSLCAWGNRHAKSRSSQK